MLFSYLTEEHPALKGLRLEPVEPDDRTAKFDLSLFISETQQGIRAGFEYATSLFERTTIERLVRHFTLLLEGIVASPQIRLAALPLLGADERRRILVDWTDPVEFELCIQTARAPCRVRPDAVADLSRALH